MSLAATILTKIGITLTNPLDLSTPRSELEQRYSQSYADGTGAGQANASFSDRRTVNATTTDSLDLAGGVSSPLTGTMTFTALKEIFIKSAAANTTNLLIGEGVSNAFVGPFGASAVGLTIPPGGILHLRNPSAAGWTVTAGTGDLLAIENLGGASAEYEIVLVGETA